MIFLLKFGFERNLTVLRSPCSTPEMRSADGVRSTGTPSHQYQVYQMVSPPVPAATHHHAHAHAHAHPSSHPINASNSRQREQHEVRHGHSRPSPRWCAINIFPPPPPPPLEWLESIQIRVFFPRLFTFVMVKYYIYVRIKSSSFFFFQLS